MRRVLAALAAVTAALCLLAGCGTHSPAKPVSAHPKGWGFPTAPPTIQKTMRAVPSETMYDSTSVPAIPRGANADAGYTSGWWPTYSVLRRQWPNKHTVSIAVTASNHADCLDVEPGDATPGQVVSWVAADRKAGFSRPCVYSSWSEFTTQVQPLLNAAHVNRGTVWEWDADYTYRAHIDSGFDATQWTDRCNGANLDCSVASLSFLSIAQPPYRTTFSCAPYKPQTSVSYCHALKSNGLHFDREIVAERHILKVHGCYANRNKRNTVQHWSCPAELKRGDQIHAARARLLATSKVQP